MMRCTTPSRDSGFSLIEAMAVVVMVAVAVPPMAAIARSNADASGDAARRHTATHLAAGVMEAVLADSESTDARLGFEGFARVDYLDAPTDGLRARLSTMAEPASRFGITFDVTFSDPFTNTGDPASADATLALRMVTVRADWRTLGGAPASVVLQSAVVNR